jgi:hypothetical protein
LVGAAAAVGHQQVKKATNMTKLSLSYEQLLAMHLDHLERLAEDKKLDDATLARAEHLGRFFGRLGEMGPADTIIGDAITEEELQTIWLETADPNTSPETIGRHPSIH